MREFVARSLALGESLARIIYVCILGCRASGSTGLDIVLYAHVMPL